MQTSQFQGSISETLQQGMRKIRLIWTAFLAASLLFCCVIYISDKFGAGAFVKGIEPEEATLIYYVLVFVGVMEVITAIVLRRIFLKRIFSLGQFPESIEAQNEFIKSLFNIYTPAIIVPTAISLSVVIYGVVLAFIGYPPGNLWIFPLLGITGIWAVRPKLTDLEGLIPPSVSF